MEEWVEHSCQLVQVGLVSLIQPNIVTRWNYRPVPQGVDANDWRRTRTLNIAGGIDVSTVLYRHEIVRAPLPCPATRVASASTVLASHAPRVPTGAALREATAARRDRLVR